MPQYSGYGFREIEKVMRREVVTVRRNDDIRHAANLMIEHRTGAVVVVEGDVPVGILTERDFVLVTSRGQTPDTKVKDVMSGPPITCEVDKKVADALVDMTISHVDHLPVTKYGRLVGIVSLRDLVGPAAA
jgi:CBS domain-containing protein